MNAFRLRQHGNTLIGIIIGLVIGLSIAVVVALAITKGAMPFTDKQSKGGKVIEPSGGQILDPNKPMYGKEAAREAAREAAKEAPAEVVKESKPAAPPPADPLQQVIASFSKEPARDAAREATRETTRESKPEPKPEPKPERSKPAPATAPAPAPALPAAAPAKTEAVDEKWVYYLQAGAFREMADAEGARAKLALLGFEAAVSDRNTDSGVLHRVRMGPFNQIEAMNRVRGKLSENGIDVAVIRNQK